MFDVRCCVYYFHLNNDSKCHTCIYKSKLRFVSWDNISGSSSSMDIFDACSRDDECPDGASCRWRWCDGKVCLCDNNTLPTSDYKNCRAGKKTSWLLTSLEGEQMNEA